MLVAVGFVAGCGDSDKKSSSSSSETAMATTPDEAWASKLCTAVAAQVKEVQPPAVEGVDPAKAKAGLVTFFTTVGSQLTGQISAIEQVGPPPEQTAVSEWKDAVAELKTAKTKITKIRKTISESDAKTTAEMNKVVADLGDEMKVLTEYDGAIAALQQSKTIGQAIAGEPACATVS